MEANASAQNLYGNGAFWPKSSEDEQANAEDNCGNGGDGVKCNGGSGDGYWQ